MARQVDLLHLFILEAWQTSSGKSRQGEGAYCEWCMVCCSLFHTRMVNPTVSFLWQKLSNNKKLSSAHLVLCQAAFISASRVQRAEMWFAQMSHGWACISEGLKPNSAHLKALHLKVILKDNSVMKSHIISKPILLNNTLWKYRQTKCTASH